VGRVLQDWEDAEREAAAQAGGGTPVLRRGAMLPAAGDREATGPTKIKTPTI
jgi:hypothetical protein